jgi:hypothetical protein
MKDLIGEVQSFDELYELLEDLKSVQGEEKAYLAVDLISTVDSARGFFRDNLDGIIAKDKEVKTTLRELLDAITPGSGLRKKVFDLLGARLDEYRRYSESTGLAKEQVTAIDNFSDLYSLIEKQGDIGSLVGDNGVARNAHQVIDYIKKLVESTTGSERLSKYSLKGVTRINGIREKVKELLESSK